MTHRAAIRLRRTAGTAPLVADPDLLVSEAGFMATVIELAELMHWRWYHTHRSDRSPSGFPDLILCRDDRVLAVELKRETGRVSPTQAEWLNALRLAGIACYVWRPSSWNEIVDVLGN